MDIGSILQWLEATGLATRIRDSLYLFPLIESTHVFGLALVFGTIAVIDLRLLGVASTHRSYQRMASDILKWTWAAFALTGATGALMFITNARVYYHNPFFRAKMLLLVLAGLNMLVFELTTGRSVQRWDTAPSPPRAGKAAAVLSLAMWIAVIFMGRIIGFTTTRAAVAAPPPSSVNFDDFLNAGPPGGAPPAAKPNEKSKSK
jgi:hypothetical protein